MPGEEYDRLVPLRELAKRFREFSRVRKRLNVKMMFRWALRGYGGVKLRTERHQGQARTTRRWLVEFLKATKADRFPGDRLDVSRTVRRRAAEGPLVTAGVSLANGGT